MKSTGVRCFCFEIRAGMRRACSIDVQYRLGCDETRPLHMPEKMRYADYYKVGDTNEDGELL
jgi:hypothetical protein